MAAEGNAAPGRSRPRSTPCCAEMARPAARDRRLRPRAHLPPWLGARWKAACGETTALALAAAACREEPPTDITPSDPRDLEASAKAAAAEAEPACPAASLRTRRRGDFPVARLSSRGGAGGCRTPPPRCARPAARREEGRDRARHLRRAGAGTSAADAAAAAQVTALDRSALRRPERLEVQPGPHRAEAPTLRRWTCWSGRTSASSTPCCLRTRPARPPAPSAATPTCCGAHAADVAQAGRRHRSSCSTQRPQRAEARRPAGLLRLLAGARRGRGPGRALPGPPSRFALSPIAPGEAGAPPKALSSKASRTQANPRPVGTAWRTGRFLHRPKAFIREG